jgi:ligand-binding SRPBCC domain-containing protein
MATLHNKIIIDAPLEKIWDVLSKVDELDKYDPTVGKSKAISEIRSGLGAARKVDMKDGKNWFEEKCTVAKPNESLVFEITACSFPVHRLKHTYSFEKIGTKVKVKQVMKYEVKYGSIGKILDVIIIRKQSDGGIKKFLSGLKNYVER